MGEASDENPSGATRRRLSPGSRTRSVFSMVNAKEVVTGESEVIRRAALVKDMIRHADADPNSPRPSSGWVCPTTS